MTNYPLKGITVLDLTRLLPGPMCTLHLADMGANVIKIEDPVVGDYARSVPPIQKNTSKFFLSINRNKRSVALDLRKEENREVFLELARNADVVVESFRPGVVDKMGIGYEMVKKVNPSIVYCSITGYGQTGPYSHLAGHDLNFMGYAGVIKKAPRSNGVPGIPNFQLGDIVGGSFGATMSILAALLQQKLQGVGQYLDVSILDGLLSHNSVAAANKDSKELLGFDTSDMLNGMLHCYNIYPTKDDRYMVLAALEYKFWERFCTAVDREDLKGKHMAAGEEGTAVFSALEELFASKSQQEWVEYFQGTDCCVTPVLTIQEAMKNEQIVSRNMVRTSSDPVEGEITQFSFPVRFSEFEFEIYRNAPLLGEDTEEVLKEIKDQ